MSEDNIGIALNRLAREQLKLRLMEGKISIWAM